jgi:hypothetical protein
MDTTTQGLSTSTRSKIATLKRKANAEAVRLIQQNQELLRRVYEGVKRCR